MPTFGHGRNAGVLFGGVDLTRFATNFNTAEDIVLDESTTLQAPGGAKECFYGNNGNSAGLDARLARSRAAVQRTLDIAFGKEDEPQLFALAPFGFEPGNWAEMFRTMQQTFRVSGGTTSLAGANSTFQGSGNNLVGRMLSAPRILGGLDVTRNETDVLTFAGVAPSQFFALKNSGTSAKGADFQLSTYVAGGVVNTGTLGAFVKAQLETLYPGRTVTVTVQTAFTLSAGVWSGALQIVFNSGVNVPLIQAVSGAVRRWLVNAGDGGNYSADGGAPFLLGIDAANFQGKQQAIDAAHAGAVTIGNSTAPITGAAHVTVSNADMWTPLDASAFHHISSEGGTGANGVYEQTNLTNSDSPGHIVYHLPGTIFYLFHNYEGKWSIRNGTDNGVTFSGAFEIYKQVSPSETIAGSPFINAQGGGDYATVVGPVVASSAPGAADFTTYFPTDAAPTSPTRTGTGSTHTALVAAGSIATTLTCATTQDGGTFSGINMIGAAGNGASVKTCAAPHTQGATLDMHAPYVTSGTINAPVIVQHAPDVSGSPGTWTTLATFVPITDASDRTQLAQRVVVPKGTTVNPWKRIRLATLTGQLALGVIAADRAG